MNSPDNAIIVLDIAGSHARLHATKPDAEQALQVLGFVLEGEQLVRPIADVPERESLVNKLIELGALFSGGSGWSPAELLDMYREQGIVKGSYKTISWRGPDNFIITER